jgi:DNA-binding transcriptional ArsR family regulator
MDLSTTTKALAALSQESRLKAFQLLVRAGTEGIAAGEIARRLQIPHNTLSSQLSILANAGLVSSRRESRSIIYSVDFDATRALLAFLMEDCCQGRPELCAPLVDKASPARRTTTRSTGENQ